MLGAADVGANHQRNRIWIVAKWRGQLSHAQHNRIRRWEQQQESIKKEKRKLANSDNERLQGRKRIRDNDQKNIGGFEGAHGATSKCSPTYGTETDWWHIEPSICRVADGVAARVDRLKAIGNGQVPLCAATAWRILSEQL